MKKLSILEKLDKATSRATMVAIGKGYPIRISKNSTIVGNMIVERKNNLYSILTVDRTILFENISNFDIAVIIAQKHNSGENSAIKKILALEEQFSKHQNDMISYLHCMKGAKQRADYDRLAMLEDRFNASELMARSIKEKLQIFKTVK